jgi:hypothetical protein
MWGNAYIELDNRGKMLRAFAKGLMQLVFVCILLMGKAYGMPVSLQVMPALGHIQLILESVGPALSGVLFILAGIFYAIGQMLPPDKKAQFHTASINIIIGAIVVGALSVASTSLVTASTHLLTNLTTNSITNNTIT